MRRGLRYGKLPRAKRATGGTAGLRLVREGLRRGWSPPIAGLIGFRLTEVRKGRATIEMDAGPQHANPMGTLHGGVICDIADAAMGMAYVTTLGEGESFTTVDLKVNFLRPVWSGHLAARASVMKKGKQTGFMTCKVFEREKLVAFATSTCMTLAGAAGGGLGRERIATPH